MNPFLIIAAVGAGIIVLNKLQTGSAASNLKYVFDKIDVKFMVLNIQISVDIKVQNPSSSSFIIKSFAGDLFVNDYYIGNVSNFTATEIQGNSETIYRVAIQVSTLALPGAILSILQNFTGITAKLSGTINVDNLAVPINLRYPA